MFEVKIAQSSNVKDIADPIIDLWEIVDEWLETKKHTDIVDWFKQDFKEFLENREIYLDTEDVYFYDFGLLTGLLMPDNLREKDNCNLEELINSLNWLVIQDLQDNNVDDEDQIEQYLLYPNQKEYKDYSDNVYCNVVRCSINGGISEEDLIIKLREELMVEDLCDVALNYYSWKDYIKDYLLDYVQVQSVRDSNKMFLYRG